MKKGISLIIALVVSFTTPAIQISAALPASLPAERSSVCAAACAAEPARAEETASSPEYTAGGAQNLEDAPLMEYEFLPADAKWQALAAGETPAAFQANYSLADGVLLVTEEVSESVRSAGELVSGSTAQSRALRLLPNRIIAEGGYIRKDVLDAAAEQQDRTILPGTVVVDPSTGTAFKVVSPTEFGSAADADAELSAMLTPLEGTYAVAQPEPAEVLKDFSFGGTDGETVTLTRGNVTGFAPHVEENLVETDGFSLIDFGDSLKDFKYLSEDSLVRLQFEDEQLDAWLGDGSPISVKVSGGIGVDQIDVTARYTGFDGYRIAMTLKQESYLIVEMDADVSQEIVIPVFGIDVNLQVGDTSIGRITGGVFVIVGMDGTLSLEIETREFTSTTVGVRGSTKFYIPTSVHPVYDQEFKGDGEVDLAGDIDGYLKFGPMLRLEVFGFKLVGAGAFLGAGVHVQADGHYLNVELYGLLQIYIDFIGKHLSLANFQPTILLKRQADTAGFQVEFVEVYVYPGRVGGILRTEPPEKGGPLIPAADIPYRILVVPKGETFNPDTPGDIDKPAILKYPASGYASTNAEGEFYQGDDCYLCDGDQVYLEFQQNGKSYFSDPVLPTLPFQKISITAADYFNDFVTGQVEPIHVINWAAKPDDPPEQQYEWKEYANGIVTLNPYLSTTWNVHIPFGGQARTMTDEHGYFDTRNPLFSIITGKPVPNTYFDVYENRDNWGSAGGFDFRMDYHEAVSGGRMQYHTTSSLIFTRTVLEVADSYDRSFMDDGTIVDQMAYDEYIWIINANGTRTVTEEEFQYTGEMFSTQDFPWDWNENKVSDYDIVFTPDSQKLTPVLDENGDPTGTALFSQRVTVQWVWQAHPNPLRITSADHTAVTTGGGSFQVTAEGYAPFAYVLTDAPQGVSIGKNTGLITIPAGMAEGEYSFTIQVSEDRTMIPQLVGSPDPYDGNDASPPAEQTFTLSVTGAAASEPEISSEAARTAPEIAEEEHHYEFSMVSGEENLTIPVFASGSEPIVWSVSDASGDLPEEIRIDAETGVLSAEKELEAGAYRFTIRAENDAGFDTQDCVLTVSEARTAPVLSDASHNYQFTKLINGGDLEITITAAGSEPITYSLVPKSERYIIPDEVSIDPESGVLTVREGVEAGKYYFSVKAENDVGSDTRECVLTVVAASVGQFSRPILPGLSVSSGLSGGIELLAASSGQNVSPPTATPTVPSEMPAVVSPSALPLNAATLRNDDPNDVYTKDRWTTNGAFFVRWHSKVTVTIPGAVDYISGETGFTFHDESPRCYNYHYSDGLPDSVKGWLRAFLEEQTTEYAQADVFLGERMNTEDLLGEINNFTVNPITEGSVYLEYGSLLEEMASQNGGSFLVDLNEGTGTIVTGKYFSALQANPGAELTFRQSGADVTFRGADIETSFDYDMPDFGYYAGAFSEEQMLAAAGTGGETFTYAFAYHGDLPGTATFAVTTDIAAGSKVNVYKFDSAGNKFTLIASGLAVAEGGVVTYQNSTMSEYLITTGTIAGAETGDAGGGFPSGGWWIIGVGTAAAAALAIFAIRRAKKQKEKSP